MKSFEQYINEELNFRLGGSSNKGDNLKTFSELEKGDEFYGWVFKQNGTLVVYSTYNFDSIKTFKPLAFDKIETDKQFATLFTTNSDPVSISNDSVDMPIYVQVIKSSSIFVIFTTYKDVPHKIFKDALPFAISQINNKTEKK